MAKDRKHTKPETWVSLREIHTAERARFHLPAPVSNRPPTLEDMLIDPALRVVRNKLRQQPHRYRYLDRDGVRHENDLSDDFINQAVFSTEESSAFWSGGIVLTKKVLTKDVETELDDEYVGEQTAGTPGKQPAPIWRRWRRDPYDPHRAVSYEEVVHRWEAYAIELLEAPALVASTPAPLPEPPKAKAVLFEEIKRRKAAGEEFPRGRAAQARDLARWMTGRAQSGDIKALAWRTIQNYLPKGGL
jgi:hypothetical protein